MGAQNRHKQVPLRVPAEEAEAMVKRYQAVIARQAASLTRLSTLLDERTADVEDHMRRANDAATRWGDPYNDQQVEMLAQSTVMGEKRADIPAMLNADLYDRLATEQSTNNELAKRWDRLTSMIPDSFQPDDDDPTDPSVRVGQYLAWLERQWRKAQAEVRNLTAVIKTQPAVVDPAEVPPWEKPGFVPPSDRTTATAGVVPSLMERDTPLPAPDPFPGGGDTETLAFDLATASKEHLGEQRPGSF